MFLIKFCNENIATEINSKPQTIEAGSSSIFQYPFIHMTGHGNVFFSKEDAANLRTYLLAGGFIHIDDNYGMEPYLRKELKKVFPEKELEELSAQHPIFSQQFQFPQGCQKFMNMMESDPRHLELFTTTDLYYCLLLKAILAMAGKMLKYITTQSRYG